MQAVLTQTFQTLMRPARAGQAIILIALGFVALIGFTGIATDTGLLFVRYTTLSRATDSAAVAAAATLRQGTDYLSMVNAATHFLVLHGISATSVLVETCATDIQKYEESTGTTDDQAAYTALLKNPGEILCTRGAAKLVRVSAQATAQTTFLSLFGFNNIALTASSVSQAASLDAVVLLDSSYSQAYDTRDAVTQGLINVLSSGGTQTAALNTYDNFTDFTSGTNSSGLNLKPYDPKNPSGLDPGNGGLDGQTGGSIRAECRWGSAFQDSSGNYGPYLFDTTGNVTTDFTDPNHGNNVNDPRAQPNYFYGGCCNAPATVQMPASGYDLSSVLDTNKQGFFAGTVINGADPEVTNNPFTFLGSAKDKTGDNRPALPVITGTINRNFANRNYVSLICMPFRDVRRGAYSFLQNVNYQAGDRTFMVTFDTDVHELTIAGEYNNPSFQPIPTGVFPGITNRDQAIYALYKYAGVESSSTGFHADCPSRTAPPYNYNGWRDPNLISNAPNDLFDLTTSSTAKGTLLYETAAPCTDTNTGGAVLAGQSLLTNPQWIRRDAVWVMVVMGAGYPNHTPGQNQIGNGTVAGQTNIETMPSNFFYSYPPASNVWGAVSTTQQQNLLNPGFCPWASFCDFKTANPGGAGGNAGTGATNPVGAEKESLPDGNVWNYSKQPFTIVAKPNGYVSIPNVLSENKQNCVASPGVTVPQANPIWWADTLNAPYQQGKLNSWDNGGVAGDNNPTANYNDWQVPGQYRVDCTIADPDVRHFCMNPNTGIINDTTGVCDNNYGAMDFARDMVDYAALDQWTTKQKGNFITMYSIFFPRQHSNYPGSYNLNDPNDPNGPQPCPWLGAPTQTSQPNCEGDIGSYIMGAKFMRYVADAGDNGTIDNHVQKWYLNQFNYSSTWNTAFNKDPTAPGNYNGTDTAYSTLPAAEDLCAPYDFDEQPHPSGSTEATNPNNPRDPALLGNPLVNAALGSHYKDTSGQFPSGYGYEDLYRYNCGNYYFAGNAAAVQQAFVSISNRLFVQIAH